MNTLANTWVSPWLPPNYNFLLNIADEKEYKAMCNEGVEFHFQHVVVVQWCVEFC